MTRTFTEMLVEQKRYYMEGRYMIIRQSGDFSYYFIPALQHEAKADIEASDKWLETRFKFTGKATPKFRLIQGGKSDCRPTKEPA